MSKSASWAPDRGEIILIDFSPHLGKEMPARHAMLVFSTKAFAERTGIVAGFPMTHAASNAGNPFVVTTKDQHNVSSYVLCHQPKSFDWRQRNGGPHAMGTGHKKLLAEVLQKFNDIFSTCEI
jgi:mRNA interferase MazF